jgi:L-lactate dehydrogenase complex protein LldG
MASPLDDNAAAREAVLARVREALKRAGKAPQAAAAREARVARRAHGPRPTLPGDIVARFVERATDQASTDERLGFVEEVPAAVARYLDALELPPAIAAQKSHRGVCWPEFAWLDWRGAGLDIEARPTVGEDRLGITGCLCAIAETGTLMMLSGPDPPASPHLLPETHFAVVPASRVVRHYEDAFALVRSERGQPPRAMNLVSGPSRTGDIEQTIVLGAHGPYRVHLVLVEGE